AGCQQGGRNLSKIAGVVGRIRNPHPSKQVWKLFPRIQKEWRKPQGVIFGKCCGCTQNLGPTARRRGGYNGSPICGSKARDFRAEMEMRNGKTQHICDFEISYVLPTSDRNLGPALVFCIASASSFLSPVLRNASGGLLPGSAFLRGEIFDVSVVIANSAHSARLDRSR